MHMLRSLFHARRGGAALAALGVAAALIGCGGSSEDAATDMVTDSTVPDAPILVSGTKGQASATIEFTAGASDGGSAITGYTVTCIGFLNFVETGSGTTSPITLNGLVNGRAYACSVTATNSVGTSAASASASVTPFNDGTGIPGHFAAADTNGDGITTRDEMTAFALAKPDRSLDALLAEFDRLDTNHDAQLTQEEINAGFSTPGS
jgi:Fibronectin type III domain